MTEPAADAALERRTVQTLLAEAATENERAISSLRALMALALAARFFLISAHANDAYGSARTGLVLPAALLAIVFSLVFLHQSRRGRVSWPWLAAATVVDAVVVFLSLLGDALFPGAAYAGALHGPDTALVLLIAVAAGFRLSVPLALLGGALNTAGVSVLVALDHRVGRVALEYARETAFMWLVLLASATGVAAVAAWRARTLAVRAAEETLRHERARRDLGLVLEGHHDAKGVLSSALLNSERLLHVLGDASATERSRMEVARRLVKDLDVLAGCVEHVRQEADGRLTASLPLGDVDVAAGIADLVAMLDGALPGLAIELAGERAGARAVLAGSKRGLSRVLWNLLKNAHDGDGRRRASRVRLTVAASNTEVSLIVEDDGPGFSPSGTAAAPGPTKPGGLGVGLESVRTLVERSGGRLELGNSALGGALVRVSLPSSRGAAGTPRA
jgi:signal transduction histidine kinase